MSSQLPPLSAPDDYESVLEELTFSAGLERQCVDVTIQDDDIAEGLEDFTAGLNTSVDRVILDPDVATVNIADNDG